MSVLIVVKWRHTTTQTWVNICSGNAFLLDGSKPLREPMLTYNQWGPLTVNWGQYRRNFYKYYSLQLFEIIYLDILLHLARANELKHISLASRLDDKCGMQYGMPFVNTLKLRQNGRRFSQTTFSISFSWMKIHQFRLIFHWSLFLRVELTVFKHWFR